MQSMKYLCRRRGILFLFAFILLLSVGWIMTVTKIILPSPIRNEEIKAEEPSFQFPSPEDRVKYYMGNWYDRKLKLEADEEIHQVCSALFGIDEEVQRGVTTNHNTLFTVQNMIHQLGYNEDPSIAYLEDALKVVNATGKFSMNDTDTDNTDTRGPVIILHPGDTPSNKTFMPSISKIRTSCLRLQPTNKTYTSSSSSSSDSDSSPLSSSCSDNIMWPLNMYRHYGPVDEYLELDRTGQVPSWEEKNSTLFFRGANTGFGDTTWKIIQYEYSQRSKAAMAKPPNAM